MILFKPHHVPLILNRTKVKTRRLWPKGCRVTKGSLQKAKTLMMSKEFFAILHITELYQQRLGDMTEQEARDEGGYTLETYREEFIRINGVWDDDLVVWVVGFNVESVPIGVLTIEVKK